jgi:hypothetical protein
MAKLEASLLKAIGEPIPELELLSADAQKQLAADLSVAHQKHDAFLQKSMEDALSHIPFLLRGAVKKILGL